MVAADIQENVISFNNGFLADMIFTLWAEHKGPAPITDHYFEVDFDPQTTLNAPTPLWDNLVQTQLGPRTSGSVTEFFEVMIGRLFYPVGVHDGWQVCLFMKGDGNT